MIRLAAIGINVVDIYTGLKKIYPGGNEYNISYTVNKLGGQSSFIGVFADDYAGNLLASLLRRQGVDISHCRYESGSSGYALVELIDGDRVFSDYNRRGVTDLHPIRFTPEDLKYIQTHDVVCISYASRLALDDYTKLYKTGVPLCYDFSDSFTEEKIKSYCPLMQFSFFSCSHLKEDAAVKSLLSQAVGCGTKLAVGTLGARGALAYDGEFFYRCEAKPAPVVDTMGAGDSFLAAFLYCYFENKDHAQAIPMAMEAGADYAKQTIGFYGSLGIGYDVDISALSDVLNI